MSRTAIALMIGLLLCAGFASAQAEVRSADHEALRTLMMRTTAAINAHDVEALRTCLADTFVFTAVDQTVLTNTQAIASYYDKMLRLPEAPLSDYHVTPAVTLPTEFMGAEAGFCAGTADEAYTLRKTGRVIHLESKWTASVVLEDGVWKIASLHCGVNLLDNPVIEIRTLPWWRRLGLALGIGKLPGER